MSMHTDSRHGHKGMDTEHLCAYITTVLEYSFGSYLLYNLKYVVDPLQPVFCHHLSAVIFFPILFLLLALIHLSPLSFM